jgi:hypothetical protein
MAPRSITMMAPRSITQWLVGTCVAPRIVVALGLYCTRDDMLFGLDWSPRVFASFSDRSMA